MPTKEIVAHYVCYRCETKRPREGGITSAKIHNARAHGLSVPAFELKKLPATVLTWSDDV